MTVRMSETDARRAGLTKTRTKTSSRADGGRRGAISRCSCGDEFTTDAAETRHMNDTGHARFEAVLDDR